MFGYGHTAQMIDLVFFYGTLRTGFERAGRAHLDAVLKPAGHGWIHAALFDLGIYPAAIPDADGQVWGEVHQMLDPEHVLTTLDAIEGYSPEAPDSSLYRRVETPVTFDDGHTAQAWVYFYNAPLGRAERIASGDYLDHLQGRQTP
jgi:gamma-glutamylcyclotransferase (GGCT)/AIG2-like uncharacterized protein YtfP